MVGRSLRLAWRVLLRARFAARLLQLGGAVETLVTSSSASATVIIHADDCGGDAENVDCPCGPQVLALIKNLTAEDFDQLLLWRSAKA